MVNHIRTQRYTYVLVVMLEHKKEAICVAFGRGQVSKKTTSNNEGVYENIKIAKEDTSLIKETVA